MPRVRAMTTGWRLRNVGPVWKSPTAAGLFAFSGSVRARQQPIVSASSFARVVRSLACAGVSGRLELVATVRGRALDQREGMGHPRGGSLSGACTCEE